MSNSPAVLTPQGEVYIVTHAASPLLTKRPEHQVELSLLFFLPQTATVRALAGDTHHS